ncbi:hypothetical protein CFP56_032816 [Quercus suber]|uniref:Uncharacterized protein n=1 Tax=Quercus suber TaxID=58331 RepID=A0AAW0JH23_QUESU
MGSHFLMGIIGVGYVGFKNKRVEISLYFADHPRNKGMCIACDIRDLFANIGYVIIDLPTGNSNSWVIL